MISVTDINNMAEYAMSAKYKSGSWLGKLPGSGPIYYHFLYALAQQLPANSTFVVLGVNQGVCCAHICAANAALTVVGVDANLTKQAWDLSYHYVNFHYVLDLAVGPVALDAITKYHALHPISAVFFDTTHTYAQVMSEYETLKPFLSAGTVLVFDDVHAGDDDVMKAIDEIPGTYVSLDQFPNILGFGVKLYQV